jgi:pimeloyl-ACP methyl ester carboxylesterase
MYSPIKPSRSLFVKLRGLKHHVRVWGDDRARPLFLFHGAWDASPTFQFLVDALKLRWRVLGLDWRGYGQSEWAQAYWLCELVADMEAFADRFSPNEPIVALGHSMGAHALEFFASVRPDRVARFGSLDGFALADESPERTLQRYRSWLEGLKVASGMKTYDATAPMSERLMRGNPKLSVDKAAFLAENLSRRQEDGTFTWAFDPRHRDPFPVETRPDGWSTGLSGIAASVLLLSTGLNRSPRLPVEQVEARIRQVPRHSHIHVKDTGHNLHHEMPERVARIVEPFLETGELPPSATI